MDVDLTPRTIRFGVDRRNAASIIPTEYSCSRLVAEIADGWLEYHESVGSQPATTANRSSILRKLGRYLSRPEDRRLTLHGPGETLTQRLHDWEQHLIASSEPTSRVPKKHGLMVRKYVLHYLASRQVKNELLQAWAAAPNLDGQTRHHRPLDEFSNRERLTLERTSRAVVRQCEALLQTGRDLLAHGRNPRKYGWEEIPNVLWGLVNLPEGEIPYGHVDLFTSATAANILDDHGTVSRSEQVPESHPLFSLLAPPDHYAIAVRVLLHLKTGWAPEETKNLQLADIEFTDTHVLIRALKLRTPQVRTHALPSAATDESPGWSAGDLIRRAKRSYELAHTLAGNDAFWVGSVRRARQATTVSGHRWLHHQNGPPVACIASLVATYELDISEPYDLRRLRKTVKSARAVLLGTLAGAAGDDHSVEVFRNHYAQSTTVHAVSAATVRRVQEQTLSQAIGPVVIPGPASEITASVPAGPIRQVAQDVAAESETDRQLSVSGCANPHAPPHREAGQVCMDAPSMCLRCPNAIVFADHIPRLLAYRQILEGLSISLSPPQFAVVYGQQLANLTEILERFPDDAIAQAAGTPVRLHLPLNERASHR